MGKYVFRPYSSEFNELYLKERAKIKKALSSKIKIEHVGSTAVQGLGGKGIIDISILTTKPNLKKYMSKLNKSGFKEVPNHPGDNRRFFMQKVLKHMGKESRIHVHLCLTREYWNSFIAFRDYLRKNKKAIDAYAKIKKDAVKYAAGDGQKYRDYKENCIRKLMKKALKYRRRSNK
ncbi:MAG: GrpB family protein [archaeon]